MLFLSLLFFIISIIFLKKGKKSQIFGTFFSLIFLMYSTFYVVADYFTGKGLDDAFWYHTKYGVQGAGWKSESFIVTVAVMLSIASLSVAFFVYKFLQPIQKKKPNFRLQVLFFLIFILSFIIHPLTHNIALLSGLSVSNFFQKNVDENDFQQAYKIPNISKISPQLGGKNLVFIYLESYEKLYLDNALFPGMAKNLQSFKEHSLYFNNIEQAYGTSWTIAGMVGSQCGLPLITSGGGGNSMHGMTAFLPKAVCMGDYLSKVGYNLHYLGGASAGFAGKGNFYTTHGFDSVEGKNELTEKLEDKNYVYDWGLYDDSLFDFAYEKYDKLSQGEERFGLFLLNLDTHGSEGAVSKSCGKKPYSGAAENSILQAYYCTDRLLGKFLEKIKNHENFQDTVIVIASDHYAMNHNNSIEKIQENEAARRMLFLILDDTTEPKIFDIQGTTLDIGATVLSQMGFDVPRFGLGVDLQGDLGSIKEREKNFRFQNWRKEYESFWEYPSLAKSGLEFRLDNTMIKLGGQEIKIPGLLYLTDAFEIEKILWKDGDSPLSLSENIPENQKSIFIDYCSTFGISESEFCIKYTKNNGDAVVDIIENNKKISVEMLGEVFGM